MSIWRSAAQSPSTAASRATTRHDHAAARSSATPTGFAIGAGAVGLVAAAIIAVAIPVADGGWQFAVMAVSVGVFAAISLDQLALAGIVVLAFLISNGLLEDRLGQLAWHGSHDLWRISLLVTAGAGGLAIGEGVRFVSNVRARRAAEFDGVDEEMYSMDPLADETRRWVAPEAADGQVPAWVSDLASAAELAGWTGPSPADGRPVDGRPAEVAHVDRLSSDRSVADPRMPDRRTPGRQPSP